jgi:hypothetical protein
MAGPSSSRYAQVAGSSALSDLTADEDVGFVGTTKPQFSWTPPQPTVNVFGTNIPVQRGVIDPKKPQGGTQQLDSNSAGRILAGLSPEEFYQVQQQLYTRGLYADSYYGKTPRPVNWGAVGDNDTLSAFRSAASLAGFTGNLDQILNGVPSAQALLAGGGGGGGPTRAPLVIELPSAEDLGAVLRQSASKLLGRDPTPAELSAFVADFQADSSAYQREAYGKTTGGGTVNRPPSADTAAESFLKEKAPVEAGAQKMESGLGVLLRMFGGGGG